MPFYLYGCSECSHEFEEFKIIAEYDVPLNEPCPSCYKVGYISRLISGAEICEPQRVGVRKVPSGYKEVIKNIKKHHPGNTLDENVWS
jgi:putative FmdB family regulatory protein